MKSGICRSKNATNLCANTKWKGSGANVIPTICHAYFSLNLKDRVAEWLIKRRSRYVKETLVTALHAWRIYMYVADLTKSYKKNSSTRDSLAEDQLRKSSTSMKANDQRLLKEIRTSDSTIHVDDAVLTNWLLFYFSFLFNFNFFTFFARNKHLHFK